MVLLKEVRDATIEHNINPPTELLQKAGSVVIVDELQKAQMNQITGNILSTYLSRACRTVLMKNPDIEVLIDDHGTKFLVKPKKYEGTKFSTTKVETEGGSAMSPWKFLQIPRLNHQKNFKFLFFREELRFITTLQKFQN